MDVVGKRAWFFLISALIILPGVISLIIPPALKPGIDFSSGSILDVTFTEPISEETVRDELTRMEHPEALIQKTGERSVFIRTDILDKTIELSDGTQITEQAFLQQELAANVGDIESRSFDTVSPIVARDVVRNVIIVMLLVPIGILLYVTWAFRRVPNPFRYGVAAIVALVHDMLIIVGIFSILGKAIDIEVNAMFIVGLLLVLGYSVNDTIVVFDRIRENVARNIDRPLPGVVNTSILESMGRSLNTSFTTLFVLVALLLFGGPTIQGLLLVLIIGVASGTYSSLCIASQFLVMWELGEIGRFFRRVVPFLGQPKPATGN